MYSIGDQNTERTKLPRGRRQELSLYRLTRQGLCILATRAAGRSATAWLQFLSFADIKYFGNILTMIGEIRFVTLVKLWQPEPALLKSIRLIWFIKVPIPKKLPKKLSQK